MMDSLHASQLKYRYPGCSLVAPDQFPALDLPRDSTPVIGDPGSRYSRLVAPGKLQARETLEALLGDLARSSAMGLRGRDEDGNVAFIAWADAGFEQECLGLSIVKLQCILAWGPAPALIIRSALQQSVHAILRRPMDLVLAQLPVSDHEAIMALRDIGFFPTSRKHSMAYVKADEHSLRRPKQIYPVREYRPSDQPHLLRLVRLIRGTQYHRIPIIPSERVRNLYEEWLRLACSGQFADGIVVAVRNELPIAFLAFRELEEVRRLTGLRMLGHGLAAVDERARGGYVSLLAAAIRMFGDNGPIDVGEFDVDSENVSVRRILERFQMMETRCAETYCLIPQADSVGTGPR